jgi:hypothetical protein
MTDVIEIDDPQAIIGTPAFWANYYWYWLDFEKGENEPEVLSGIFGCNEESMREVHQALFDEESVRSYRLTIPFPGDFSWEIEIYAESVNNIIHPEFPGKLPVGWFRRAELNRFVECLKTDWKGLFDWKAVSPLLVPYAPVTKDDDLDAAQDELRQAWLQFGLIGSDGIEQIVRRLTWVADFSWRYDPLNGWLNDRSGSYRNPRMWEKEHNRNSFEEKQEMFMRFSKFMDMVTRHTG